MYGLHADVSNDTARQVRELVAAEPNFTDVATPVHLEPYLLLLGRDCPVSYNSGLIYELPHAINYPSAARLVGSDSEEGQRLMKFWEERGLPEGLFELGFGHVADLWKPWCVAVVDHEIASIAFAARLAEAGAELRLSTVKTLRRQGFGAATTAGWFRRPQLRTRTLFYSTDRNNASSQRVTQRLGLQLRGGSLRISST
ncbi:hypothetical protein QBD01_001473 [Ochrobactrum sp. 19YEA23]|uniref:GNAT family N-acetyltransferase n=1 Tax=Ochrobactrum sp. 19YEA23 TaxID=3039854 RepID=UPI00247832B4|nr:hypothetical protein [Ochrobactrum sp. 19YEA23]